MDEKGDMIVPTAILEQWQDIVNILAEIVDTPAALIMRVRESDIEVFVSSKSEGNPYHFGFPCSTAKQKAVWNYLCFG